MKVALYCRSSIKSQEHSIEMQETVSSAYAAKHQLLIDERYCDEAVSARKTKIKERKELSRLLADINNGVIGTLIVYKRDRLARNVEEHMEIFEILKKNNTKVYFSAGNEMPLQYTPVGEFFELVMAGFNEREATQIALRIRETKYSLFLLGKHHGSKLPYGYKSDKDKKIEKNSDIKVVKKIYTELLKTTCKSLGDFQKYIEEIGIRKNVIEKENGTSSKTTRPFNYQDIKNIIQTTEYKGLRTAKFLDEKVEIEIKSLEIIPEKEWEEANDILKTLIQTHDPISILKDTEFVLNGLVYCSTCDKTVKKKAMMHSGEMKVMYCCTNHTKNRAEKESLEKYVFEKANAHFNMLLDSEKSPWFIKSLTVIEKEYESRVEQLVRSINSDRRVILSLSEKWLKSRNSDIRNEMIKAHDDVIYNETELTKAKEALSFIREYPEQMNGLRKKVRINDKIAKLDDLQKKEFMMDIVKKVVLYPKNEVQLAMKHPFLELVNKEEKY